VGEFLSRLLDYSFFLVLAPQFIEQALINEVIFGNLEVLEAWIGKSRNRDGCPIRRYFFQKDILKVILKGVVLKVIWISLFAETRV
jgi:hypothetical protein